MNKDEIIALHDAISSMCKDSSYILHRRFDIDRVKKLNEDLEYIEDYLANKLIEFTSIGKQKESLSDNANDQIDQQ